VTRILVVEDNEDLAFGLRNNLEIEGYEVMTAGNGRSGLATFDKIRPDLVILDLMLPEMDGFRVLRTLRENGHSAPILVLTARGEESDKVRGLRLGADDYVTKPFGLLELLARVEALLRRAQTRGAVGPDSNQTFRFGPVEVDAAAHTVHRGAEVIDLAPKEFDLLLSLLKARGAVVSRLRLLREVWGYSSAVVTRTVDTHIAELRRKLEENPSSPQYIITVRKSGYRIRV
jgi:two-component system, OmpR family, alkaline phosphatase synthesis response regulator PhoP